MDNQNSIAVFPSMPPPDVDDPDDGSEDEPEMTSADRIAAMLRRVGDSPEGKASVRLYRIKEDSKGLSWCANYSPVAFEEGDLEMIRKEWGPGRYEIRLYAPNPATGKWGVRAAERLELETPAPTSTSVATAGDSALAAVLTKMNEKIDALAVAPRVDPAEQIKQTLGLITAMREAFGANQQPREQSTGSAMREIMQTIQAMKAIRTEIEPPSEPSDPLAASLPKILELIAAASHQPAQPLPTLAVPASMQTPALTATPAPARVPAPAANETTLSNLKATEEESMQLAFTSAVTLLNLKAAAKADIEEAAELVYGNSPDDLFEILRAENWFETLTQAAPSIAPFRDWYTRVRDRVLAIDAEESATNPAIEPAVKTG
jgi:hypothetical protein